MENKFEIAIQLFDNANSNDPNVEIWNGKKYPKELLYALRMSEKLNENSNFNQNEIIRNYYAGTYFLYGKNKNDDNK